MSPLLEVRDIRAFYHQRSGLFKRNVVRAVDGVSLSIDAGETVAVVGESGSGKTTLGRAILRLMDLSGGSVFFDGTDVAEVSGRSMKALRRRMQVVFQDPYSSISPYMTVMEIVQEPLVIHGISNEQDRRSRVFEALDQVKLSPAEEIAAKYPHALSGGQRQRVSLARAMVLRPELVIADEPVSMVDASSRVGILSLLHEIQDALGTSFLYITHDIANARHFSDRIAVMYAGTVVETGPTRAVIDHPAHPYTKALLAAVPEPDPANSTRLRTVMPGEPPAGGEMPSGCPFHPRCPLFQAGTCDATRPDLMPLNDNTEHEVACLVVSGNV